MAASKKSSAGGKNPKGAKNVGLFNAGLVVSCLIGTALSYYAYNVEIAKEKDQNYEALCDISERVSCTKALMSKYGKGFGLIPSSSIFYLPNPLYGLAFYALVALLSVCNDRTVSLFTAVIGVLSNLLTVYLGYVLYLLDDICILCVGSYVVNALIGVLAFKKYRRLTAGRNGTQKKKKH